MSKIIEAQGLTKVYPPSTKAVDGISFSVAEGEICDEEGVYYGVTPRGSNSSILFGR